MPVSTHYYHSMIRKYVTVFGKTFNEIQVIRFDKNGVEANRERVPLSYSPKEKWYARINEDYTDPSRGLAIKLPRMGFEITNLAYAPERKLSNYHSIRNKKPGFVANRAQYPAPYDISFQLSIIFKNIEEGSQIVEQIIPFFQPDFTPTVNILPELNTRLDVPIVLTSVMLEDTYDGAIRDRRANIWTMNFMMKTYFYPMVTEAKLIKTATTNMLEDRDGGLLLNRTTTEPVSLDGTTPVDELTGDDDFGFSEYYEDFVDGINTED